MEFNIYQGNIVTFIVTSYDMLYTVYNNIFLILAGINCIFVCIGGKLLTTRITSARNDNIKFVKSLHNRKTREELGLFFIEGIRFTEEAVRAGAEIKWVFFSRKLLETRGGRQVLDEVTGTGVQAFEVSDSIFENISDTGTPQGILAVIKIKKYTIEDLTLEKGLLVLMESVQDPGNMGTIIRTADASGAKGVVLSKGCVDVYNPKTLRSTMGSIFHLPVYRSADFIKDVKEIKKLGVKALVSHLKGEKYHFEVDMQGSVAIIIGNEANGISEEAASLADELVKIPMPGQAESLNASVAAGILMYEAVKQRMRSNS